MSEFENLIEGLFGSKGKKDISDSRKLSDTYYKFSKSIIDFGVELARIKDQKLIKLYKKMVLDSQGIKTYLDKHYKWE